MRNFLLAAFMILCALCHADDPSSATPYPLTTCLVSGDKLGAMNSPVMINYHGTEVRFCCHDCAESFQQNPAKYLAKLKGVAQK